MIVNPYIHKPPPAGGSGLPEKSDLEALDFASAAHVGAFCQIPAKAAVDVFGLDFPRLSESGASVLIGNE